MPTQLTDRFCRAAKPETGKRQSEYFDAAVKGLSLCVSQGGARSWFLTYTHPTSGKRARVKMGTFPEVPLAAARQKAVDARATILNGVDPVAEKAARAISLRVRDLVENYVERRADSKRSAEEIARRLRKNVSSIIGDVQLSALHRRDLTRCIDAVRDRGAGVEANRVFEDLRAMVRWARARGDLDENLCEGMRPPTETAPRERVLSAEEIKRFWTKLPDLAMEETTRQALRLALVTGQRIGEVCGAAATEFDLDEPALWTIPAERAKNGREHRVPLSPLACGLIKQQIQANRAAEERRRQRRGVASEPERPSPFLFPGPRGNHMDATAVPKALKRDFDRLGMEPFVPHDLRRTVATHMEELGTSPFVIGHVLNHVSEVRSSITSRVYARYSYDKEKREALERWAERLSDIAAYQTTSASKCEATP